MSDRRKAVVVLLSGGMDSVTALYSTAREHDVVGALSFDYRAKHNSRELECASFHAKALHVTHITIDLAFIGDLFTSNLLQGGGEIPEGHYEESSMKTTVVPFRNGILLSVAAGFAESRQANAIVIGAHRGDHAIYPDCRDAFIAAMASAIQRGTYAQIELLRPFISLTKGDIAQIGRGLGIDYSKTWSCYVGGTVHCGRCGTCVERKEAFANADMVDPTVYEELLGIFR